MSLNIKTPVTAETPNGYKRVAGNASGAADKITYSNTTSGLNATNVQNAIDETLSKRMALNMSNITTEGVAKINSSVMENYEKGSDTTAITAADSIDEALAKHENRLDNLGAAAAKGVVTTIPTTTATNNDVPTTLAVQTELNKKANETTISSVNSTVSVNTVPECLGYAGVKMIGGKTQKCKNLFNFAEWKSKVTEATKGTLTYSDTKESFTITATEDDAYVNSYMSLSDMQFKVKPNTNYTLSWKSNGVNGDVFVFKNTTYYFYIKTSNSEFKATFTTDASETSVAIRFGIAKAGDSDTFSNIQLEEGTTATSYEPYHADLWNAPTEKIVSCGKNLFDKTDVTNAKIDGSGQYTPSSDGSTFVSNYIPVKSSTNYYLKDFIGSTYEYTMAMYDDSKNYISSKYISGGLGASGILSTDANVKYVRIHVNINYLDTAMFVESDSEVSGYSAPFKNEISLSEITKNLPDYGCSVPKADGSGDIYNYIDFENMKYYRNVASVDMGTITWNCISGLIYAFTGTGSNPIVNNMMMKSTGAELVCSIYEKFHGEWSSMISEDKRMITINNTDVSSSKQIIISDKRYNDGENEKYKNDMSGVSLVYELADSAKQVIDLTSFIPPIKCETGGTITLANTHSLDVPNTICYKKEV